MKNLLLLMVILALLSACASADKMLERGDYDGLINLATKKLSGKKKKDEYVKALEKGFEKITKRDMAIIESLKNSDNPQDWEDIMKVARDIDRRQEKIEPLLPLISVSGYHAKFTFVHTDDILTEAKITAINLYEKRLDDMDTKVLHTRMDVYKKETLKILSHYPESIISRFNADQKPLEVLRDVLISLSTLLSS